MEGNQESNLAQKLRKYRVRRQLAKRAVPVSHHLGNETHEDHVTLRSPIEVLDELRGIYLSSEYSSLSSLEPHTDKVLARVSPKALEAMRTLLWVLGVYRDLEWVGTPMKPHDVIKTIRTIIVAETSQPLMIRPNISEILEQYDLVRTLKSIITKARDRFEPIPESLNWSEQKRMRYVFETPVTLSVESRFATFRWLTSKPFVD